MDMPEIRQIRAWALAYLLSYLAVPLMLIPGVVRSAAGVAIALCWVRLCYACLTTREVRKLPPSVLAVGLLTGPVGAVLLRRRTTTMQPLVTLRVKPRL